jgi:hypothetical protein
MQAMNDGQLTADEARQLGREQSATRAWLNRLYGEIRAAAVRGNNTMDVEGLDKEVEQAVAKELNNAGFVVEAFPWKMMIRWL